MSTNILPNQDEQFFQVALSFVPNVGSKTARALLNHYGTAADIFRAPPKELTRVGGVGEVRASMFRDKMLFEQAEQEITHAGRHGINILFFNRPGYPQRLLNCDDAPLLLYYKGEADLNAGKVVAVIGTRKNTDYGQRVTEEMIEQLGGLEGVVIVSGLALGIDTIAHKASLKQGIPTVGVLGHGLDMVYPPSNRSLAKDMLDKGGLLSEFPCESKPDRQHFPVRNRIVAGMSDVTVIVESDIKGGAMITAYLACSYNREVAAFPGRVYDAKCEGPNHLIRKNIASLIRNGDDLQELMGWGKSKRDSTVQRQLFLALSPEEQRVLDLLQAGDPVHADDLMAGSEFTYTQLASVLLQLEMQGLVKTLPGKRYRCN